MSGDPARFFVTVGSTVEDSDQILNPMLDWLNVRAAGFPNNYGLRLPSRKIVINDSSDSRIHKGQVFGSRGDPPKAASDTVGLYC